MASSRKSCREPILVGWPEDRSPGVGERLLRLLLAFLVIAASGFPARDPARLLADSAPSIQERSASFVATGLRPAKVAPQPRGSPTRQNGSGPFPDFSLAPLLDPRPAAAPRGVRALREPPRLVLPRRLNRPLYSGTPPPALG